MTARDRILVALDTPDENRARDLVDRLRDRVGGFKIGLELFSAIGPRVVTYATGSGARVFLDLKLHDIPNTVAGAAGAAAGLGVSFLTVHALGGPAMIEAAVTRSAESAAAAGHPAPVVLAVTILTSHDDDDLVRLGVSGPCRSAVLRLTTLARESGAGGVVCSPLEVAEVRQGFPDGKLVVPGVRSAGSAAHDQARVATPGLAVRSGADHLVIGRPITAADDPESAVEAIVREIEAEAASPEP